MIFHCFNVCVRLKIVSIRDIDEAFFMGLVCVSIKYCFLWITHHHVRVN